MTIPPDPPTTRSLGLRRLDLARRRLPFGLAYWVMFILKQRSACLFHGHFLLAINGTKMVWLPDWP